MSPCVALVVLFAFQTNLSEQGLKALDEKRYQAAIDSFTQAVAADPKDYSLHFNLALAYSLSGKNAEAIPEYKKTLELKPGVYQAELNLGISLLREKRAAEAVPLSDRRSRGKWQAIPAELLSWPKRCSAPANLRKAEQSYSAALAIDPKSPDAELGSGARLSQAGQAR